MRATAAACGTAEENTDLKLSCQSGTFNKVIFASFGVLSATGLLLHGVCVFLRRSAQLLCFPVVLVRRHAQRHVRERL